MSANDIPAVVRQLSQPGIIELGAFPAEAQGAKVIEKLLDPLLAELRKAIRKMPPSPLTASAVCVYHAHFHPFVASTMCRHVAMQWRRIQKRRRKRHARYRRGREGVRPRLRGRR